MTIARLLWVIKSDGLGEEGKRVIDDKLLKETGNQRAYQIVHIERIDENNMVALWDT